eukprot:CAMPEP_0182883538 /NCGR_PEP_ID=MMETSP0034_2-20130328/18441_1 /TAXON_ID=156128 /ORGANISM="Nephroselmis pyriformis, Strain CCMP717" /LENGTH=51 /DNA_ID=CAMNT_0025016681 /DNA_START=297 /DNA_END=449 /DNA_ORIENTATION=-
MTALPPKRAGEGKWRRAGQPRARRMAGRALAAAAAAALLLLICLLPAGVAG